MLFRKKSQERDTKTAIQVPDQRDDTVDKILAALTDPILVLDKKRVIIHANQEAQDLFGKAIVGRNIVQCLRQPQVIDAVDRVFKTKQKWVSEVAFPAPVQRHLSLTIKVIGDGEGVAMTVRDTTLEKRTEEMHSDFVANVSHELRSPLSSLLGFIETLQGPAQDDREARERFLNIMIQEANRMARLIDDLLSLSRVQIQEHMAPDETVDLALVLKNIADISSLKAQARDMVIQMDEDIQGIMVPGDQDQITQVFQNLIDNAIKYGREGTEVKVTCRRLGRLPDRNIPGIAVEIADQGDGIAEEHIPRLTERFYRIDKARSRSMGGTGLGLAIVKHIIARHRGRLQVNSTVGEGSVFSVLLPTKS